MSSMIGQIIGSYKIVRQLGHGGMGEVFEAVHEKLHRRAAIKIQHPHVARAPEMAARFRNEARAVNIIRHPGVVDIYEHGQLEDGTVYIVMEYLEGQSLGDYLAEHGQVSPSQVVVLCQQIASALAAAHNKSIIHRDLKPEEGTAEGALPNIVPCGPRSACRSTRMGAERGRGRRRDEGARSPS